MKQELMEGKEDEVKKNAERKIISNIIMLTKLLQQNLEPEEEEKNRIRFYILIPKKKKK